MGRLFDRPRLERSKPPPPLSEQGLSDSRRTLLRGVIDEATVEVKRLEEASESVRDPDSAMLLQRLAQSGARLTAAVAARPDALATAQRALTYHLPKAAMLAQTLIALEDAARDDHRRAHIRLTLARIDNLFEKTELDLLAGGAADMDLELRLINQALDEDLGGERQSR